MFKVQETSIILIKFSFSGENVLPTYFIFTLKIPTMKVRLEDNVSITNKELFDDDEDILPKPDKSIKFIKDRHHKHEPGNIS